MAAQGIVSTYNTITLQNRMVRVPNEDLLELEPQATALTQILLHMKRKKMCEVPRLEWFNDDFVEQWVTASAAVAANASSTTLSLSDGSAVVVGDLLLFHSGGSSNHEMVRVTAKPSTNVATIVRNVGSTGLIAVGSGAGVMILGQGFEEGSGAPVAKTTTPTSVVNYTQIFKKTIFLTGTAQASRQYVSNGDERARLVTKAMKEFKIQLNNQLLFGKPSEDLTGGPTGLPIRTTGGIDHYVQTNRTDIGGLLTWKALCTFSLQAFRYTSEAVLFCSPLLMTAFNNFAKSHVEIGQTEHEFGLDIRKINMGNGRWILVRDHTLRDGVSGQNGFGGYGYSLDMDYIAMKYLKGRDIRIKRNVQANDEDSFKDTIEGEIGLTLQQEKRHARIYGITDYSA